MAEMFFSGIADEAGKPLDAQIRAHKELGWQHIEIRNVNETTLAYASDAEFDAIRGALEEAGLRVSCFASQIANWARDIMGPLEKDLDELRRATPRMRKMETPFIRVMSWVNKSEVEEAKWRSESIRRMKELARVAEDGGVTLVHENCDGWGGLGPKQTLDLLAEVNSPALQLVFDTGNVLSHGHDTWDYYSQVKPHAVYVHIKDWSREKNEATFPGEGDSEVRRILADLFASGYDGGLSIEPHIKAQVHLGTESDPKAMYDTYVEYGRRLLALVADVRKAE